MRALKLDQIIRPDSNKDKRSDNRKSYDLVMKSAVNKNDEISPNSSLLID